MVHSRFLDSVWYVSSIRLLETWPSGRISVWECSFITTISSPSWRHVLGFCSGVQRVNVVFNWPVSLAEVLPVCLCDAGERDIDLWPRPWWKGHWARGVHGSGAQLNLRHLSPHQILQKQTQGMPLFKYLHVKKNFYTPGLQLLIFPIHLPRK